MWGEHLRTNSPSFVIFLSDTVYHYDAETRTLTMVNPPESLTKDLEETRREELEIGEEERGFDNLDDPPFKPTR